MAWALRSTVELVAHELPPRELELLGKLVEAANYAGLSEFRHQFLTTCWTKFHPAAMRSFYFLVAATFAGPVRRPPSSWKEGLEGKIDVERKQIVFTQ